MPPLVDWLLNSCAFLLIINKKNVYIYSVKLNLKAFVWISLTFVIVKNSPKIAIKIYHFTLSQNSVTLQPYGLEGTSSVA